MLEKHLKSLQSAPAKSLNMDKQMHQRTFQKKLTCNCHSSEEKKINTCPTSIILPIDPTKINPHLNDANHPQRGGGLFYENSQKWVQKKFFKHEITSKGVIFSKQKAVKIHIKLKQQNIIHLLTTWGTRAGGHGHTMAWDTAA